MTAPRIAFVSPRFSETATVGGAETLLKSLALHAAEAGCQVDLLTTCASNHFTWANELPPGARPFGKLNVIYFPVDDDRDIPGFLAVQERISRRAPVTLEEEQFWLRNNVNSRAMLEHLRRNAAQYDRVVVGPYLFGLTYFVAQVAPEKTVLVPCLHDEAFAYLTCFRTMCESVRVCMFNSAPERELAARLYGARFNDMPVVGMGLDDFEVDATAFARRRGLTAPYVIYSGRREPLKGTPMLMDYLNAFRLRTGKDVRVVLTGSGHVDMPQELAPFVLDLGFVTEVEKHEAMAGALVFCHPSVNESFGIVIMESWLARTPVLVTGAGAVLKHQCRESGGGLWFHNYPEFEEELLLLLDNQELRKQLGSNGHDYVMREYSWPVVERKLLAALAR